MADYALRRRMMVDTQVRPSDVTKFPIIDAMLSVPRERFVPDAQAEMAYADAIVPLEDGRSLLEPRSFAKMLDALAISQSDLMLDIGSGYGYSAAISARMAEAVVALEENKSMGEDAGALLAEVNADNVIQHSGPLAEGAAEHGPYDVILIEGGVEALPEAITDQLKDGGRIACLFMEDALGVVRIGHKHDGVVSWRFGFNATAPILPGFEKIAEFAL